MTSVPDDPPGRAVDVALAEFTALRAELLGHSTSQNAVLGLGLPAIGVLLGLAINNPAQRGLLVLVPVLCGVMILVYCGLAYRIVVVGNYVRHVLWPDLERRLPGSALKSWEDGLAKLEKTRRHRWLSQVVEVSLVTLLVAIGLVAEVVALVVPTGIPWWLHLFAAPVLVVATGVGARLLSRRPLTRADFGY